MPKRKEADADAGTLEISAQKRVTVKAPTGEISSETLENPETRGSCSCGCYYRDLSVSSEQPSDVSHLSINPSEEALDQAASRIYLPVQEWQTRILTLHPGSDDDPLIGKLSVVDLLLLEGVQVHGTSQRIFFDALSYTWGPPEPRFPILLNEVTFQITENLFRALRFLRYPSEERHLWIDAVCINQRNAAEKSVQIQTMLTFYRKAQSVIAWLGLQGEHTSLAMRYLRTLNDTDMTEINPGYCDFHRKHLTIGFQDLYSRSWTRRLWVKQEVFASRKLVVRCGNETISWERFKKGSDVTLANSKSALVHLRQATRIDWANLQRLDPDSSEVEDISPFPEGDLDIMNTLRDTSGLEASDPRDHIYAVLSTTSVVVRGSSRHNFSPRKLALDIDYKKTISEAFKDLASYLIQRDGWQTILYLGAKFGGEIACGDILPSWVPDWRDFNSLRLFVMVGIDKALRCTSAPFETTSQQYRSLQGVSGEGLILEGYVLAHVGRDIPGSTNRLFLQLLRFPYIFSK